MNAITSTHRHKPRIPQTKTRQNILKLHHNFITIWQVQECMIAIWNLPDWRYVPEEDEIFKDLQNSFSITDDI